MGDRNTHHAVYAITPRRERDPGHEKNAPTRPVGQVGAFSSSDSRTVSSTTLRRRGIRSPLRGERGPAQSAAPAGVVTVRHGHSSPAPRARPSARWRRREHSRPAHTPVLAVARAGTPPPSTAPARPLHRSAPDSAITPYATSRGTAATAMP